MDLTFQSMYVLFSQNNCMFCFHRDHWNSEEKNSREHQSYYREYWGYSTEALDIITLSFI